MDKEAWPATGHEFAKSQTQTKTELNFTSPEAVQNMRDHLPLRTSWSSWCQIMYVIFLVSKITADDDLSHDLKYTCSLEEKQ